MITSLEIRNYALIEALLLQPHQRLNVVTGETGAGKSIMLGAIGLLLGKRADTKVLLDEGKKCVVEAVFDISDYELTDFFREEDIDYADECIIRREISPAGKSRAFINDTPVTLEILKRLGPSLMDIHSQHENLELGKNTYQLMALDHFAQHQKLIDTYKRDFGTFRQLAGRLEDLESKASSAAKEQDYQQFILTELEEAKLEAGEQAELEQELVTLENAEEIKERLSGAQHLLDESESSTLNQLKEITFQIGKIRQFSDDYEQLYERLDSTAIELRDIYSELQTHGDRVIYDPQRAEEVKGRLDTIYRLQSKHGIDTVEALLELQENLTQALTRITNLDVEIADLKKQIGQAEEMLTKSAKALSESRKQSAKVLSKQIVSVIQTIGIENGTVEIRFEEQKPSATGADKVEFLFSANKGVPLQVIREVASGGEFSRLIFALKYLIADKTALPTIIFDEIDTGVSGEIAIRMVRLMQKMAANHQILSISHLPQFAAGANHHYMVYKDHAAQKSVSRMKLLPNQDRIQNIAGMIGGDNPSTHAQASAKELLKVLDSQQVSH